MNNRINIVYPSETEGEEAEEDNPDWENSEWNGEWDEETH